MNILVFNTTYRVRYILKFVGILGLIIFSFFACEEDKPVTDSFKEVAVSNTRPRYLIPYPNNITYSNREFSLEAKLCYTQVSPDLKMALDEMDYFYKGIVEHWQRRERKLFLENRDTCTRIHFTTDNTLEDEAYKLEIRDSITVHYKKSIGAYYALQTLKQIIRNSVYTTPGPKLVISNIRISDQPRFEYRGIHLDVARHYFPAADIKRFIKMLSQYKINSFHWHLTDDQGWRIEIKRYPKLQTIASKRAQTIISTNPDKYDGQEYGGYYTQKEIKDIVQYAKSHFVQIIPEIDMPGHTRALLAAYPELSCGKVTLPVATKWGIFDHILCPTDTTITFIKNILNEVVGLFPGDYIHIGGDESTQKEWAQSAVCSKIMEDNNYENVDDLYSYFMLKIIKHLNLKGKKVIGWDEIVDHNIGEATVMSWRGIKNGNVAAKAGQDVIMTPSAYCYLDHYQSLDSTEPKAIGGYTSLKKVYSYNPAPNSLGDKIKNHIIGTQGNIWTEYMNDFSAVSYMAFPRALAIAENGWTEDENKTWRRFANSVDKHIPYIRKSKFKYSKKYYEPNYKTKNQDGFVILDLIKEMDAGYIRYWSTRSNSERLSQVFSESLFLTDVTNIRMKYFSTEQKFATENIYIKFKFHKAAGRHILIKNNPTDSFKLDYAMDVLINGIKGNNLNLRYNQEWKLIEPGTELLIDIEDTVAVDTIALVLIQSGNNDDDSINIQLEYGENSSDFTTIETSAIHKSSDGKKSDFVVLTKGIEARYIKIIPLPKSNEKYNIYIGEIEIK